MNLSFKTLPSWLNQKQLTSPFALCIGAGLLLLPLFITWTHFLFSYSEIQTLSERVEFLQKKQTRKESQVKSEERTLSQISRAHPKYLEEVLGSMVFLGAERQKWKLFAEQIEASHPMKQRVSFLEHGTNRLQFVQTDFRKNELFQETEEKQKNAVEISEDDLKALLCHIEGARIHPHIPKDGAPQMLLKSFELEKKSIPGISDKTYHLQMELIKREALNKS